MKTLFYVLLALSFASVVFNIFKLDFDALLIGDSQIAMISIVAALCVMVLAAIMIISLKIKERQEV
ncbi:MAG: hypothetical protein WBA16_08420 [Nonlabens sp.]